MPPSLEIKICGLTNIEDARQAVSLGADYLGFVLYPPSPRGISPVSLEQITAELDPQVRTIGVFVNMPCAEIADIAGRCGLYAVQLHGTEKPQDYRSLTIPVWRAVTLQNGAVLPSPEDWGAKRYVVDAAVPGMYGGTGEQADWDQASAVAARLPIMLAGGLTPENVAAAVARVHPLGVDVASGVESRPGKKDWKKLEQFVTTSRQAERDR